MRGQRGRRTGGNGSGKGKQRLKMRAPRSNYAFQAVIKSDHLDYVVQKCTEAGVDALVPFLSERCVKRPDAKSAEKLVERSEGLRWKRQAVRAFTHSGCKRPLFVSRACRFRKAYGWACSACV